MRFGLLALGAATLGTVAIAALPANAGSFVFDSSNNGGNSKVGYHEYIKTTFNPDSEVFTWESTFGAKDGNLAEGAWLVINDGPNPKQADNEELTIYYLDATNIVDGYGILSAYAYNGKNNSNSWKNSSNFIQSWDKALKVTKTDDQISFKFSIDATDINSQSQFGSDWQGTQFNEKVGIWFHGADGLTTEYDSNGKLTNFSFEQRGWYAVADQDAEHVPEPALALGLGAAAAVGIVRRKRSA